MARFAGMRDLDVWYSRLDVSAMLDRWTANIPPEKLSRLEEHRQGQEQGQPARA